MEFFQSEAIVNHSQANGFSNRKVSTENLARSELFALQAQREFLQQDYVSKSSQTLDHQKKSLRPSLKRLCHLFTVESWHVALFSPCDQS
jgi:hypothetical protein